MSKHLRLDVAQLTDVGRKRPHNEDNMAYVIPKDPQVMTKKGALFIVADGMGGHAAGEVASEIAVDTVSYAYYQEDNDDIAASLVHAIKRANTLIHQRAAENMLRSGMGTTCVAGVLRGGTAYIANVGDSRTYLVRNGLVRQISQDHSWVAEQVRAGLLTEDQARSHAQRNVITRCLGTQADVEVDIFSEELEEGDSFILCSDGLSGFVSDDDLRAIVNQYVPQESVYHLVERANENGGPDNITAIVVRIQEVGWDPPSAHRNGYTNGRDIANQTTLTDAQTTGLVMQGVNGRVPTAPLPQSASALYPSETITAPQPAVQLARRKRGRLLYPTLILFILLIVTLVGGGVYYLLHINSPADFDASLKKAQILITQGQDDIAHNNPSLALQHLSVAQAILLSLQNKALTDTQKTNVRSLLNGKFTEQAKAAIVSYNTQSSITSLPCTSTIATPINSGGTNARATNIATIQSDTTKSFSYILGEDDNLYQLTDTKALQSAFPSPNNTKIIAIASDGSRLLALAGTATQSGTAAPYSLLLFTADGSGTLKRANPPLAIDAAFTKDGNTPGLLSAWSTDVYVVLTSKTAPASATILYYTIDAKNKLASASSKYSETISESISIVSIAAFPNRQLFLLAKDGSVQSLTFTGGTQTPSTPVSLQNSIATPLAFDTQNFNPSSTRIVAPNLQKLQFLQLPGAKMLVAGTVADAPHLYVVDDNTNHRILNLEIAKGNIATTTATATKNVSAAATTPVIVQLDHQYVSPQLFVNVKGMVADPTQATQLYLIVQNEQSSLVRNLIIVDMTQNATCEA
ncbi:MAG: hypothetical protein NVS4B12_01180 [Ktedonobacteraceae bacterium]